eukprot:746087-Hanusia_phi.AAC.5
MPQEHHFVWSRKEFRWVRKEKFKHREEDRVKVAEAAILRRARLTGREGEARADQGAARHHGAATARKVGPPRPPPAWTEASHRRKKEKQARLKIPTATPFFCKVTAIHHLLSSSFTTFSPPHRFSSFCLRPTSIPPPSLFVSPPRLLFSPSSASSPSFRSPPLRPYSLHHRHAIYSPRPALGPPLLIRFISSASSQIGANEKDKEVILKVRREKQKVPPLASPRSCLQLTPSPSFSRLAWRSR